MTRRAPLRSTHAFDPRRLARERLARERGTLRRQAPVRVALLYPSPYRVAMSSLGYQTIYREIHALADFWADRAFLPDDVDAHASTGEPLFGYESGLPIGDAPIVAVSIAYENELGDLLRALRLAGIEPVAARRGPRAPFLLGGGPLTFSNPLPLGAFFDAVLLGEAEQTVGPALEIVARAKRRDDALDELARRVPGCWVPAIHGERLPPSAITDDALLPAAALITTPEAELSDMFLVEAERGCSRGCHYCVMRRSTHGGMRIVPPEVLFERIPPWARRVGLVGAAVSDHPRIVDIVQRLVSEGREVSLSSLRPDRLSDALCEALRRAGHRTLTTAVDGASQRLRDAIERKTKERHLVRAAELARTHGFERLKLYVMIGLPGETDEDIDELVRLSTELSRLVPLALGVAPFVSKRNTPLDGQPFAGIDVVQRRLERLRRGVRGRVDVRATSARWAWVEWVLAQGGIDTGLAVLDAVRAGGRFADYVRAFDALAHRHRPRRALPVVA
ncbi:MAG: B12-binding domain-containing radical SAM protein [Myxococcota bacterium]|nr:B12-binding domain-containing radical SAM protein [Myxococcota bacterium]MDW8362761.1 radical SAM protein [Myxococcales bacterium]